MGAEINGKMREKKTLRKSLLCAVLLTTITLSLVPLATLPAATAVSTSNLGQQIAPNVYVLNRTHTPDVNTTSEGEKNHVWTSLPQFFLLGTNAYKVVTVGNDTWNQNDSLYAYWVRLISDPDGSLNSSHPTKSGDEVAVWTWFVFENGTYSWTLNSRTRFWYQFNNNTGKWNPMTNGDLTNVKNAIALALLDPNIKRQGKAYLMNMASLATNVTAQPEQTSKYAYFSYWVDMAYLPKIERNPTGYDFNAFVSKDRFITFVAYNDTNSNGIMDFNVGRTSANIRSLKSSEVAYVFRPISAGSVTFIPVNVESSPGYSEAVGWGFKVQNLLGAMVNATNQYAPTNTSISSVEFDFHFMRNSTQAITKVDEKIGEFRDPNDLSKIPQQFNGLSLAIVYYSFFEGLSISKYPATPTNPSGNTVDVEGNSTATNTLLFKSGGQNLVTIRIGGDTYTWNGTQSENANSETLPWYSMQSSFTTVGNQSVVKVNFDRSRSVYAVCFPEWSGCSITHDPYFAVATFNAQTSASGLLMLIMAGAGLGVALAAATVLIIRRRKTHSVA
jgi:hypothetical protein